MRNVVQLYLAANNIPLMRKRNHAFLLLHSRPQSNSALKDHVTKKRRALGTRMLLLSIALM